MRNFMLIPLIAAFLLSGCPKKTEKPDQENKPPASAPAEPGTNETIDEVMEEDTEEPAEQNSELFVQSHMDGNYDHLVYKINDHILAIRKTIEGPEVITAWYDNLALIENTTRGETPDIVKKFSSSYGAENNQVQRFELFQQLDTEQKSDAQTAYNTILEIVNQAAKNPRYRPTQQKMQRLNHAVQELQNYLR
jgi:hypothetical protein